MRGFSKAIITGNLTRDPELRSTPNGSSVCSFSVAVNRVFKDSAGRQQESVSFIDCSAWGKLGEMINQRARKGTGVLVSGRLDQRSWEDKTTRQKRSRVEVVVEDFNFMSGMEQREDGTYTRPSFGASDEVVLEDIPEGEAEESAKSAPENVPEDIPEDPIDLSEIPF